MRGDLTLRLGQLKRIFEEEFPRITGKFTIIWTDIDEEPMIRAEVRSKKSDVIVIDMSENFKEFPSDLLMAQVALIG